MLDMIALAILLGLLLGVLANLAADNVSTYAPLDRQRVQVSLGAPVCAACGKPRSPLAWSGLLALLSGRRRCPSWGSSTVLIRSPPTGAAVTTNARFPQITGELAPTPGMGDFHFMFSVALQRMGGRALIATLFPVGPRQCPQFSATVTDGIEAIKASVAKVMYFIECS